MVDLSHAAALRLSLPPPFSKLGLPVGTFLLPDPDIRIPPNTRHYFSLGRRREIVMMVSLKVEPPLSSPDECRRPLESFNLELALAADQKLIIHKTLGGDLFFVQLGHNGLGLEEELHGAAHCLSSELLFIT